MPDGYNAKFFNNPFDAMIPKKPPNETAFSPFKVGDIVRLVSGSPDLTVMAVTGEDVQVTWFHRMDSNFGPCSALNFLNYRCFELVREANSYKEPEE
jgi:uncharacterized protein YodC (DUF2158 family)